MPGKVGAWLLKKDNLAIDAKKMIYSNDEKLGSYDELKHRFSEDDENLTKEIEMLKRSREKRYISNGQVYQLREDGNIYILTNVNTGSAQKLS